MDYATFKRIKQNAVNSASWNRFAFWAFEERQLKEGAKKVGARKNKRGKYMMTRIAGGGFLTVEGYASWRAFWDNWDRYEKAVKMGEKELVEGLVYEYRNHEAQFGMGGRETAEAIFPRATQAQKNRAWRKFMKICAEQDLF